MVVGTSSSSATPHTTLVASLTDEGAVAGVVPRWVAERDNLYFANVLVFLFTSRGELWIQQRAEDSFAHGGRWDVSACGAVRPDETPQAAGHRAMVEETGQSADLTFVARFENRFEDESGRIRRRLSHVFVGVLDEELHATKPATRFKRIPSEHVAERVSIRPEAFVPSFLQEFAYAAAAFDAREAALQQSIDRHPSSSWRHVRRQRLADSAPHTVDIRFLGLCQLRCAWCWGPEHMRTDGLSPEQWQKIIAKLKVRGTRQLVFSGGEPTLSKALRPALAAAKDLGMRVTLSSNGIRLRAFEDVVAAIDDLGIPVDGSTPVVNETMRARSINQGAWEKAIDAIVMTQSMVRQGRSRAQVTVRTVIARPNLLDVPQIPVALERQGVDLSSLRLKTYQVEPFGPHTPHLDFERDWAVSDEEATLAFRGDEARLAAHEHHAPAVCPHRWAVLPR